MKVHRESRIRWEWRDYKNVFNQSFSTRWTVYFYKLQFYRNYVVPVIKSMLSLTSSMLNIFSFSFLIPGTLTIYSFPNYVWIMASIFCFSFLFWHVIVPPFLIFLTLIFISIGLIILLQIFLVCFTFLVQFIRVHHKNFYFNSFSLYSLSN